MSDTDPVLPGKPESEHDSEKSALANKLMSTKVGRVHVHPIESAESAGSSAARYKGEPHPVPAVTKHATMPDASVLVNVTQPLVERVDAASAPRVNVTQPLAELARAANARVNQGTQPLVEAPRTNVEPSSALVKLAELEESAAHEGPAAPTMPDGYRLQAQEKNRRWIATLAAAALAVGAIFLHHVLRAGDPSTIESSGHMADPTHSALIPSTPIESSASAPPQVTSSLAPISPVPSASVHSAQNTKPVSSNGPAVKPVGVKPPAPASTPAVVPSTPRLRDYRDPIPPE